MRQFLCADRLYVRWLTLSGTALLLFILAWILGYSLLPEGVLRGRTAASALAGETGASSFLVEWARIFTINLVLGSLILAANRVLRINGYPLGYLIPLVWIIFYGVMLGTNSFAIPLAERMAPSLAVLGRAGVYEMLAYILMATATYAWPLYTIERLFVTNPEPVSPKPVLSLPTAERFGLGVAIVALALANAWEAYMIVNLSL
jgi:hypothetical protein